MIFRQLFDKESSTYTYLLGCESTRSAVLIDPVKEQIERDLKLLEELGLTLKLVLDTHVHADHITAAGELRERTSCDIVRIILADPVGSSLAGWVEDGILGRDSPYAIEGIGASEVPANLHREVIDGAEKISDEDSFAIVKRLIREEGLLVGGSSGTNVAAALRVAARNDVDGPVVTVLPDGWDRYRAQSWMRELGL